MNKTKAVSKCIALSLLITINASTVMAQDTHYLGVSKAYSRIDKLIYDGRYNDVIKISNKILDHDSTDVKAKTARAYAYSNLYKLDAAFKEFKSIIEKDPSNSDAHNGLGTVYYRKTTSSDMQVVKNKAKLYEMAFNEFTTAIKLDPKNYKAYDNAGLIKQKLGDIEAAEKYYRESLEINPKYSESVEHLGSILFAKKQIPEAISKYEEAISLNSKNSSAYYHLAEALISKGEYSKAIKYLNTSLYLYHNSSPVHNMLGNAYALQGNETAAITEYKKASLINPDYSLPYINIANIYQKRGDSELAISELKNAVSVIPNFFEGKLKIADISLNLGQNDQAITYYKDVIKSPELAPYALKGLAKAYFDNAKEYSLNATLTAPVEYEEAKSAIKEIIENNPDDIELYLALLRISRLTNDDKNAMKCLNKIKKNDSDDPISNIVKGEAYIAFKMYMDADAEFKKAISYVNKKQNLLYIGEIFIMNRQYAVAKEAFYKILATDIDNNEALQALERIKKLEKTAELKYRIAKEFFDEKQNDVGLEMLRESVAINPNFSDAQFLLAKTFENKKFYFNAVEHYTAYLNLISPLAADFKTYNKVVGKLQKRIHKSARKNKPIKKYTRI